MTLEGGETSPPSEEPKVEPAPDSRPPFARKYPHAAELDALLSAFEAGNYAKVRADAPKLAERANDPEVARALRDLRRRIEPDPLQLYLLAITAALLAFLTVWFFLHRH